MTRRPKHPLNRYASCGDWQVEKLEAIAAADVAQESLPTMRRLEAAIAFYKVIIDSVGQRFGWANWWILERRLDQFAGNEQSPELYDAVMEQLERLKQ